MRIRRAVVVAAATVSTVGAVAAPAAAVPDTPASYELPGNAVFPEGIDVLGGYYYVTSTHDGSVLRGDLRAPRAEPFIAANRGQFGAVGIRATPDRLVVAGGPTGTVTVYNRHTGARVAQFSNGGGPNTFVNDIALAPDGSVYITDSNRPLVYRLTARQLATRRAGVQPLPVFRNLQGTVFRSVAGAFNANGIVVTPDGRFLVIVNAETGALYRIRIRTGAVTRVAVTGGPLAGGDGLVLLSSDVLYVVRNAANTIAEVRLSSTYRSGRVVSTTTSPDFDFLTTAAVAGDRLLVVNSQFDALLAGQPATPPFRVSSIALP